MVDLYGYSIWAAIWIGLWIISMFGHKTVHLERSIAIHHYIARFFGSHNQMVDLYSFSYQVGLLSVPLWEFLRVTRLDRGEPLLSFAMGLFTSAFVRVAILLIVRK